MPRALGEAKDERFAIEAVFIYQPINSLFAAATSTTSISGWAWTPSSRRRGDLRPGLN